MLSRQGCQIPFFGFFSASVDAWYLTLGNLAALFPDKIVKLSVTIFQTIGQHVANWNFQLAYRRGG